MKRTILILIVLINGILVFAQSFDNTFSVPIAANGGIRYSDGSIGVSANVTSISLPWSSVTGKPTTIAGYGITDAFNGTWNSLTGKPSTFPASAHNHDLLYKPITYVPAWNEITNKPDTVALKDAIPLLNYIALPQKTTIQINAMTGQSEGALVYDLTLHVIKYWNGSIWKLIAALN
jgi:hypothetical protein